MAEKKEQFKNYRVGEIIGRGRFAIVYEAEKLDIRKKVALKVLNPDFSDRVDIRGQFREQARQQAKLSHPRLIRIEDLREEHGQFFVAMEYMPLGSLNNWVTQNGMLSFRQAAVIVADVAEVLDFLHGKSMVHGDVKPGNILLAEDPNQKNTLRAKLSDLRLPLSVEVLQTVSENLVDLTPEYISPEQAGGAQNTPLSDQYSLGVVAYEMLCGQPPFSNKSQVDLYIDHQRTRPSSLQQFNEQVTPELEQVVFRALEKSPEKRYPSCGEFARALRAAAAATEQKRLELFLSTAEKLLEKQEFGNARETLREALLIQPDNEKANQLSRQLEQKEGLSKNYQQAVDSLKQAEEKALAIRGMVPNDPDEAGLLKTFAPPPPPIWKQLADRWKSARQMAGLLLLISLACILSITIWVDTAEDTPKPTIVAINRTSTPTYTPTFTPSNTPTSTYTFTPTNTPTITPTPLNPLSFIADGSWDNLARCPDITNPCWTDSSSGEYENNTDSGITSYEIFVDRTWENPYLFYWQKYHTEACCDFVLITINGFTIQSYSGTSDWEQIAVDLKSYKGQTISIRFMLHTDYSGTSDGWYLRDIEIVQNATLKEVQSANVPTSLPTPIGTFTPTRTLSPTFTPTPTITP